MIIQTKDIPYLKDFPRDGRIRPVMTYFNGEGWLAYHPQPDSTIFALNFVDLVSGLYVAVAPASEFDFEIPLLTFLFQYFPKGETFNAFEVLHEDLENALAMLEKQFILFPFFRDEANLKYGPVISTEIEYALFNHRSAYDLLNRFAMTFLEKHGYKKNQIPDSFRKVVQKSADERLRYGFSTPLSNFYTQKEERFMIFRSIRDAFSHGGLSIDAIFKLENGFGISGNSDIGRKLKGAGLWEVLKPNLQDLGSVFGFLALLADDLFSCLNDFTKAFVSSFQELPKPTAPGHFVYSRSRLSEHRLHLADYIKNPWRFPTPSVTAPVFKIGDASNP